MATKISKKNTKRLPKGQRTHTRRLKQAARKEVIPTSPHASAAAQPVRVPMKQDQS